MNPGIIAEDANRYILRNKYLTTEFNLRISLAFEDGANWMRGKIVEKMIASIGLEKTKEILGDE